MIKNTCMLASAVILAGVMASTAHADAVVPNFIAPSFVGQPNTTYQQWYKFLAGSLAGPNAPSPTIPASWSSAARRMATTLILSRV